MAREPRVLSVAVCCLLITIAHVCSCTHYGSYTEYILESEKICHIMDKQHTHHLRNATAALVTSHHMFDRWDVKFDRKCQYTFKANGGGIFAVIQKMFFRHTSNGTQCLDYVRFKRSDGYYTEKICGKIDRTQAKYLFENDSESEPMNITAPYPAIYDKFAEYDSGKILLGTEVKTEIFISKEKVPDGQTLDLSIIYTPYKNCKVSIPQIYAPVGHNVCIRLDYICDKIHNCPYKICSDEVDCMYMVTDRFPKDDTATKVTVGAVTTMILCFIIFVMCLWICKKSHKLCWSSDCAGPNVCSRPGSLPQDADSGMGSNRAVPTAPMLEVVVSSPVADKDLPPSYDSLFPEQSNPARS